MTTGTITINTTHGDRVVPGSEPVPGLLVHESFNAPGWSITHRLSGLRLVRELPNESLALAVAQLMGSSCPLPWTRPTTDLLADLEVYAQAGRHALSETGAGALGAKLSGQDDDGVRHRYRPRG